MANHVIMKKKHIFLCLEFAYGVLVDKIYGQFFAGKHWPEVIAHFNVFGENRLSRAVAHFELAVGFDFNLVSGFGFLGHVRGLCC